MPRPKKQQVPPKIEEEAKAFLEQKNPPTKPKPMTSRVYLTGQAMSGLLARTQGPVRMEDIKREAEAWADFMLKD
jgi:hypothetical protein